MSSLHSTHLPLNWNSIDMEERLSFSQMRGKRKEFSGPKACVPTEDREWKCLNGEGCFYRWIRPGQVRSAGWVDFIISIDGWNGVISFGVR